MADLLVLEDSSSEVASRTSLNNQITKQKVIATLEEEKKIEQQQ